MIQEDKKVTILSPCYNVEQFLPKYFETVLGQTYTNLQIVLIDDGSKDNTWQIMQEYATKDSRVEIFHQENQGVSPTRNNLLDKVKGDYVLFVDSDDWIELDMVESLVTLAEQYNSKFVMCDRLINDDKPNRSITTINILSQEQAVCDFLHHEYFVGSLWNKLFYSDCLPELKFHGDIWYGEDALFCWSVLQNIDKVVVTNKQLYHYRMNNGSITHLSFGEKKMTGHRMWKIMADDVKVKWPRYTNLVLSTWALEDMHLLQVASQDGYPYNENVELLQRFVRNHYHLLLPRIKSDIKTLIYATMIMWWYGFGKIYYKLFKIKIGVLK